MRYPEFLLFYGAVFGAVWILEGLSRLAWYAIRSRKWDVVEATVRAVVPTTGIEQKPEILNRKKIEFEYEFGGDRFVTSTAWLIDLAALGISRYPKEYIVRMRSALQNSRSLPIRVNPQKPFIAFHEPKVNGVSLWAYLLGFLLCIGVIYLELEDRSLHEWIFALSLATGARVIFLRKFKDGYSG